jgi:hypothetical protein
VPVIVSRSLPCSQLVINRVVDKLKGGRLTMAWYLCRFRKQTPRWYYCELRFYGADVSKRTPARRTSDRKYK